MINFTYTEEQLAKINIQRQFVIGSLLSRSDIFYRELDKYQDTISQPIVDYGVENYQYWLEQVERGKKRA